MRVALCLSGQPRSLQTAWEYMNRNLLQVNQPDVFIHTWSGACSVEKQFEIEKLYNPTRIDADHYFHQDIFKKYTRIASAPHPAYNTGHMLYSVWAANELKRKWELQAGFRYDIVVRCRFDYALNRTLPLDQVELWKVYVPNCRMTPGNLMCNDQFAWGTSEVMDMYSATFPNLDHFYRLGFLYNGEDMLSANLQMYGLTGPQMVYTDMNNPFPPGPYNSTTHSLVREDFKVWNDLR